MHSLIAYRTNVELNNKLRMISKAAQELICPDSFGVEQQTKVECIQGSSARSYPAMTPIITLDVNRKTLITEMRRSRA